MTAVAHDVPHGLEHATATGLDSRKLAIWTFIGSECMFFASLISNYVVNKGRSLVGPFPHEPWTSRPFTDRRTGIVAYWPTRVVPSRAIQISGS